MGRTAMIDIRIKEYKDGLTEAILLKEYSWIVEAEIQCTVLGLKTITDKKTGASKKWLVWYSGIWHKGTWLEGLWKNGQWLYGTWKDGVWLDGIWRGGQWLNGIWIKGTWKRGVWVNGEWRGGKWESGTWMDGIWLGDTLKSIK